VVDLESDVPTRALPLFAGLSGADLRTVGEVLNSKTFSTGTRLMDAEQIGEVVYLILSGTVKVHLEQEDGTDVIIAILGPGDIVGEMSALDNRERSASVVTLEKTQVLWMDRASFESFLRQLPLVAFNLSCILSKRLRLANAQIQALAAHAVESRVARQLIAFADRYGEKAGTGKLHIPIRLTQSDIASLVGASREHTNKVLVSYRERGYLSVSATHHITILNKDALAKRC
jgi:CRP/FNR family cyclic AMP-dependent transcriptional regulator